MAVLGVSTNTRLLGMAVITKHGLAAYKMQLHKSSWSPSKATVILSTLEPCVRQYSIKKVVLSIPPKHYQTKAFICLLRELERYFQKRHIEVVKVDSKILYSFCQDEKRGTKKEIMQALVEKFPELTIYFHRELRNKNRYYVKLFDAVGVATLHAK